MNSILRRATLLSLLLAITTALFAQQGDIISLYQLEGPMEQTAQMPAYEEGRQYIQLNRRAIQEGFLERGDRLGMQTGEVSTAFQVERITQYTDGSRSIIARSEENPGRMVSFTVEGERILGAVHLHDREELYRLAWDPDRGQNYVTAINYGELDILSCPADEAMAVGGGSIPDRAERRAENPDIAASDHSVIDLMVVYTEDARNYMESGNSTSLFIAETVNRSQMALDNSEVLITLNLVHTEETNYEEDPNNTSQTLRRLTDPGDGHMDNIHQIRDNRKADMVTMFARVDDVGGIAWILTDHSGRADIAFSVNRVQQLSFPSYTMVHELGHNMGNHHGRDQNSSPAPASGGLNDYSTGWRWTGNDGQGYVSVMTYEEGDERVAHFSNPDITYQGVPTGSYNGQYAPADNARSMNEIRGVIADYRISEDTPPSAPVLNSPQDGETGVNPATELSWSASATADNYRIQVATSSGFNNPLINETLPRGQTSFQPQNPLDHLTTYFWRVRASNENGTSPYSQTFSFQTVIAPPENVNVLTPADGAVQIPISPELTWEPSARAARYLVQISTEPDFSTTVASSETNSTTFTPPDDLEYATEYYWRVRAENEGGVSDFSAPIGFITEVDETEITMNYPNPFRNSTTIRYQLAEPSDVLLEVYNPAGRRVRTLVDEQQQPRVYNHSFDAAGLASGTYIVRLLAGDVSRTLMMTLIK